MWLCASEAEEARRLDCLLSAALERALKLIDYWWDPEGAVKARHDFLNYLKPFLDERRVKQGDDVLSMHIACRRMNCAELSAARSPCDLRSAGRLCCEYFLMVLEC